MIRYDIYDFNREVLHILCGFNFAVYRKHLYLFGGRLFFFFLSTDFTLSKSFESDH